MSHMFPEPTPREPSLISPTLPAGIPARPDGSQVSQNWMEKGQEITAKLLYDLGGWIFGGLIVVALMLLQDLISLGFADRATLIAGLAIAIALPFNLVGLGVIRYFNALNQAVEEAKKVLTETPGLDVETLERLTLDSSAFPSGKHKIMDSTVSLSLYLSVFFTMIGLSSALWRISWAVTLIFLIAAISGVLLILRVIRYS
jgi:hypothetical protein